MYHLLTKGNENQCFFVLNMFITTDTIHIRLAFSSFPSHNHVDMLIGQFPYHQRKGCTLRIRERDVLLNSCPAVLPVHSYRVQMEIHFNNLYKQVGYAQSLQF